MDTDEHGWGISMPDVSMLIEHCGCDNPGATKSRCWVMECWMLNVECFLCVEKCFVALFLCCSKSPLPLSRISRGSRLKNVVNGSASCLFPAFPLSAFRFPLFYLWFSLFNFALSYPCHPCYPWSRILHWTCPVPGWALNVECWMLNVECSLCIQLIFVPSFLCC